MISRVRRTGNRVRSVASASVAQTSFTRRFGSRGSSTSAIRCRVRCSWSSTWTAAAGRIGRPGAFRRSWRKTVGFVRATRLRYVTRSRFRPEEFVGEGQGVVTGDVLQEGVEAGGLGVLGFGGVPQDAVPRLDHAEAGVAGDLLVVGPHELAEELDGLGDGVAVDLEPGLAEQPLEPPGLGAGEGAEGGAGPVDLEGDGLPAEPLGAEFGDERQEIGVGVGRRGSARGDHGEALWDGNREAG